MSAREQLAAGNLSVAIRQVAEELKSNPGDTGLRIFLFELLCFSGDLDRAKKQLEAAAQTNIETELAVQPYKNLLACEERRRKLFAIGLRPRVIGDVSYTQAQFAALDAFRDREFACARQLLEEAEELRPYAPCRINGHEFEDLKDANDLVGPFAEVIVRNEYCWIAWEQIASLHLEKPRYLRDLMWIPGQLQLSDGSAGEAFFPVLYADSWQHNEEAVKLGRETRWRKDAGDLAVAFGQRTILAGDRDFSILEVETLELEDANSYAGD